MSDFGDIKDVKTRKERFCDWCGEAIPKGSKVPNYKGMWQGQWQNWYMHNECFAVYEKNDYNDGDGFEPFSNDRPDKADK